MSKPGLKIKIGRQPSVSSFDAAGPSATPVASTPSAAGEGPKRVIVLKKSTTTPSAPSAPAPQAGAPLTVTKTKAGRPSKPTAKLTEARKRANEEEHTDGEDGGRRQKKPKVIKFMNTPTTISIKGSKGRVPFHPPGEGYDSEAEDREVDPTIEEEFILRMLPGEHCEYIRKAIEEKRVGTPGADIKIKFLEAESRRAVVTVQNTLYAAVLVDLPTITEGMKTWDKRALLKTADICQMLLVFAKIKSEAEARKEPLPPMIEDGHRWPHGITPPMHDCVKRRFRKRISKKEIENKEAEVERLLKADQEAFSTRWEYVDDRFDPRDQTPQTEYSENEQDADGEVDDSGVFGPADGYEQQLPPQQQQSVDNPELDADFEAALVAEYEALEAGTPANGLDAETPMTNAATPAAESVDEADDDAEGEEEDDDDEDDDDDVDEDEQNRMDEVKGVKSEIRDLKNQLSNAEDALAALKNPILRKRIELQIKNIKAELHLKHRSIGQFDEED